MSFPEHGVILFADDVREEVGGKISIMGLLGPNCWVNERQNDVVCAFFYWATGSEITVQGGFEIENAPDDFALPAGFTRKICKREDDLSDVWLVQIMGKLRLMVGEAPLLLRAKFEVAGKTYVNQLELEFDDSQSEFHQSRI